MTLYTPTGAAPIVNREPPNPYKYYANQKVCFSCRFEVEDRHTSATCMAKRPGHQDGFTRKNYKQYKQAGRQFRRKGMHKTMYHNM